MFLSCLLRSPGSSVAIFALDAGQGQKLGQDQGREGGEETELELGKPCLLRESVGRGIVNKDARYGEEDGMSDLTCHVRGCRWH